jgi:hypothetical protein
MAKEKGGKDERSCGERRAYIMGRSVCTWEKTSDGTFYPW